LRFWDSNSYKIWMSSTGDATWGGRLDSTSDYNMYFRMTGGTNRGFVFKNSTTNVFQIESTGQLRVASNNIYAGNANIVWHAGNDGAGSGLDADLLDGYNTATGATGNTIALRDGSGHLTMNYGYGSYFNMSHGASSRSSDTIFYSSTDNFIRKNDATGMRASLNVPTRTGGDASGTWAISITGSAGTLDGVDSSQFLRSDAADQKTSGTLRFNDNIIQTFGTGDDFEMFCNGSNMYFDMNSTGVGSLFMRDGTTTRFTFARSTGAFTATGNVTAYSDITLKENIELIPNALDKLQSLRGITYDRTDLDSDKRHTGVIAQEVEEVLPEAVETNEDGIKSVAYGNMVGLLIEAIKEQQSQINSLKQQITELRK